MTEPLTVLVAEDEALIRMDLVETLEELGFKVVAAVGDGGRAVDLAGELRPQLALLDIKMPDMDGLAAASAIISLDSTAVVMLTAFSQPELIQRAVAAGAMGYLNKLEHVFVFDGGRGRREGVGEGRGVRGNPGRVGDSGPRAPGPPGRGVAPTLQVARRASTARWPCPVGSSIWWSITVKPADRRWARAVSGASPL